MDTLAEPLRLTGTLFLLQFHWLWMLTALGLGAWIGWRTAAEKAAAAAAERTGGRP